VKQQLNLTGQEVELSDPNRSHWGTNLRERQTNMLFSKKTA